jgi:hypothetical protein
VELRNRLLLRYHSIAALQKGLLAAQDTHQADCSSGQKDIHQAFHEDPDIVAPAVGIPSAAGMVVGMAAVDRIADTVAEPADNRPEDMPQLLHRGVAGILHVPLEERLRTTWLLVLLKNSERQRESRLGGKSHGKR